MILGTKTINPVWLAELRTEVLSGDERSVDVLKLLSSYDDVVTALRAAEAKIAELRSYLERGVTQ